MNCRSFFYFLYCWQGMTKSLFCMRRLWKVSGDAAFMRDESQKWNYERIQWWTWIIFLSSIAMMCFLSSMRLTKTFLLLSRVTYYWSHSSCYGGVVEMEMLTLVWKWYLSRIFLMLSVSRKELGAQGFLVENSSLFCFHHQLLLGHIMSKTLNQKCRDLKSLKYWCLLSSVF